MQKKYEWKRFFCKRGDEDPVLLEDAYLYDPEDGEGYVNRHVVSLEDIESFPCIVILGEPGMGKSTALEDEVERIQRISNPDILEPIPIRMEEFSNEGELRRKVFESQRWLDWKEGDKILSLILDSLDEVKIYIENACTILTEGFRDIDKKRLRLRICCRTGEWTSYFENELSKLWEEESVAIYRILPLRERDIKDAVEKNQVKAEDFFLEVKNKEVQPFAAKPITLETMIDEFKKNHTLPKYQWEIYEKLCLKLCDEPNPRYRETPSLKGTYKLDKLERIKVASKIAAVMAICNRKSIYQENENEVVESVLTFKQMSEGQESRGYVLKDDLKETLRTSIFNSHQANSFVFGHQSYMEFLAARYLCDECQLSFRRLKGILITGSNGQQKVVPQMREIAAWCSNRNNKLRGWMIKHDPLAMICSDLSMLTNREKYSLVENMLFELERLEFFDPSLIWAHGRKVKQPKIGEQLKNYIEDISKSPYVREAAIDIARQCRVAELGDLLVDVVTNSRELPRIRSHACYALENVGTEEQKRKIKGVLLDGEEEINDELKGSLLRILWPDFINIDELLGVLTPGYDLDTISSYCMFVEDLGDRIETNDIPKALQHFSNFNVPQGVSGYSFERMLDKLFLRGLANIETNDMKTAVAEYMLIRLETYHEIVHDAEKDFQKIIKSNANKRRELVDELLKVGVTEGDKRWILVLCVSQCIDFEDFFWLLDTVDNHTVKIKIILMNKAYSYLIQYEGLSVTSEHVTRFLEKLEQCEKEVKEDFKLLKGISLDSEEAKRQRKRALERKKHEQEEDKRRRAQTKPDDIVERELPKAIEGQSTAWFLVCVAICSEGDRIKNDYIQKHFLPESERWEKLREDIKSNVVEAAFQFLVKNPPKDNAWLSSNSRNGHIWSGQIALSLIAHPKDRLNGLHMDVLKAWIPTVIGFWGTPDEGFKKVIKHSYEKCSETFIEYLNIKIDYENECDSYHEIIYHLVGILDENLKRYLFGKLKEKTCKPKMFKRLCDLLLKLEPRGFVEFLVSKTSPPWPDSKEDKEIGAIAFQVVLCNWSLKYWETIRTCLSEVPEMCQKALYDLGYGYRHGESDTLSSLEPWQLGELYVWLRNYKYQKEGTVSTRAGSMEDYSYLTLDNYIINRLIKLATLESMKALKYIQKNLKDEHKQYFKYHLNKAEEERQRKYWQRLTPEEVIKLSWEEKRRMFIIKLEILFFILCVLNIVVCLIFKGVTANELVQKLWGSYWTLFTLINTAAICIWYWLLSEEEKESFKQKIREFVGWRT